MGGTRGSTRGGQLTRLSADSARMSCNLTEVSKEIAALKEKRAILLEEKAAVDAMMDEMIVAATEAMLNAAAANDKHGVRTALDDGADPNRMQPGTDGTGVSALMWSTAIGNLNIGKLLLDRGADPNKVSLLPSRSGIAATAVAAAATAAAAYPTKPGSSLCNACHVNKASPEFSNKQKRKAILKRRCKGCVDANTPMSSCSAAKLANLFRRTLTPPLIIASTKEWLEFTRLLL